jgi:hypothetical protein
VGKPKSVTVRDANTGELYVLQDLPIAGWPTGTAPKVVFECGVCKGRFPPEEWRGGCPGCAEKAKKKDEGGKHKRRWTLTED